MESLWILVFADQLSAPVPFLSNKHTGQRAVEQGAGTNNMADPKADWQDFTVRPPLGRSQFPI